MKDLRSLILLFLLPVCLNSQEPQEDLILGAMHSISSHDLLQYVRIQCDEKYQGRLTGTPEYQECAEWLAGQFRDWGITPAGDNGSWFQWFSVPYTLVFPDCGVEMHLTQKDGSEILKSYKYVTEYMPGSTSGNGVITAEVVYAGYGITAPELGYDDYRGIDAKGKIILIEREAPVSPSEGREADVHLHPSLLGRQKRKRVLDGRGLGDGERRTGDGQRETENDPERKGSRRP